MVLSDTIQEFNGQRYYLCGFYFQRNGKRLHRAVWEHHHGQVPKGSHVHHVDGDRANNAPRNLILLDGRQHVSGHSKQSKHEKAVAAMQAKAKEWHRSAEGRKWHRENISKAFADSRIRDVEKDCSECGRAYLVARCRASTSNTCSNNCKSARFRRLNPGYDSRFKRSR